MASTLGILDVLSRLREESERASTALAAQEVGLRARKCLAMHCLMDNSIFITRSLWLPSCYYRALLVR